MLDYAVTRIQQVRLEFDPSQQSESAWKLEREAMSLWQQG